MTELKIIISGSDEEKDPVSPCPICGVMPVLEARICDPAIHFFFRCPECQECSAAACSLRTAKKNWNIGNAQMARDQKRISDF